MNSKIPKAIGAVVLACLVMIVIVIYTPKPALQRSKRGRSFVSTQYLKLANHALSKATKANRIANENSSQLLNGEKIDFDPLTAANTSAIGAIAEANTSIKLSNEEFQRLNKGDASLKKLIEANIKLIASLNQINESVKVLNTVVQHRKKENTQFPPPSIKKIIEANTEVTTAIEKGVKTLSGVIKAYGEYYQLGNVVDR
ncbi:hypothetical protein F4Y93_14950 [Candidatus Poribacteria bacterium]|nr:hypothetical protein [Candidatus Poribacteria bacterium]